MRPSFELLLERSNRTKREYYIDDKKNPCNERNYERGLIIILGVENQEEENNAN